MIGKIKDRLYREAFLPSLLSIMISPVYLIRNGLYRAISGIAPTICGDILDFGCGSKPYQTLFVNASSYIGVDIEVSGHDHKNSKIDYFYDGKNLPFPDSSFDAVVCFEVLEHVFNIEEVFSEMRRVLRPNGQLLLSIPFAWPEHEVPYDFARYTSYGVTHILKENGFEVVDLVKTTSFVRAVCQLFIEYFTQHVFPRRKGLKQLFQVIFVFPLNVIAIVLDFVLPKRYEYFCNTVILGKKIAD